MGEERRRIRAQQCRAGIGLGEGTGGGGSRHHLDPRDAGDLRQSRIVAGLDGGVHQGARGRAAEQLRGPCEKATGGRVVDRDRQPGVGAELSCAQGDGPHQPLGDPIGALGHRSRKHEDRVHRAHLGKHRNGLGAASGDIEKSTPAPQRAGEADRSDDRVGDQPLADAV